MRGAGPKRVRGGGGGSFQEGEHFEEKNLRVDGRLGDDLRGVFWLTD